MENKKFRNSALGVIINKNNEILICLSHRDKYDWKFPQGGIEINETEIEGVIREINEELGLIIKKSDILKIGSCESYFFENGFEIKLNPFLIKNAEKMEIKLSPDEFIDLKWIKPKEILNLDLGVRKNAYINILKNFNLI